MNKIFAGLPGLDNIPQKDWGGDSVAALIEYGIAAAGLVAAAYIVVCAVTMVTSNGDSNKTKKAIQGIIFASIGLVICIVAEAISYFIFNAAGEAVK